INEVEKYTAKSSVDSVRRDMIAEMEFPHPSLPEQKEIVQVLSDFNEHIDNLTELIEKKKAIRDGALEDLVSGRTRVNGFDGKWEEKTLKELCYLITKQTGFDYSAEIKPSLVINKQADVLPFIQNKDFEKCSVNYNTDFYIPEIVAEKYPRILLDDVCMLISISGRIGNVGVFDNKQKAFAGGAVGIAKFYEPKLAIWCMYSLMSKESQEQIFKHEKVGAQHNLTVADVRKLIIKIPSNDDERDFIINTILCLDDEIQALETEKVKMLDIREGAMDDLLTGRVRLKI
ncbi:MAG: restriction endonuclease subunit S, partial [Anaerovoracaceae bacterium]